MRHYSLKILSLIGAGLVWIVFPEMAVAVDGVILIDQNRAMAGGVTPGDTSGFPVEINIPGSYRLSSNLTVGTGASAGIKINSGNVTIDLNGFTIIGAGVINAPDIGIDGRGIGGVTVINGNIFHASAGGVLLGDFAKVEDLRVTSTVAGSGIEVGDHSIVRRNVAYGNFRDGISAGSNSLITGNTANHNGFGFSGSDTAGILALAGSTVSLNTANDNADLGIATNRGSTVSGNTTSFNKNVGILTFLFCTVTGNTAVDNMSGKDMDISCPASVVSNTTNGGIFQRGSGCVLDHNAP